MKSYFFVLALALSSTAFATPGSHHNTNTNSGVGNAVQGNHNSVTNAVTTTSTDSSIHYGNEGSGGNSAQKQKQSQTATGGKGGNASSSASNTGNSVNVNNNDVQQHRVVPGVIIGSPASGPCTGASGGVGLTTGLFGFAANSATVSRACDLRELARVAAAAGRSDIANKALEAAADDLGLNEKAKPAAEQSSVVAPANVGS